MNSTSEFIALDVETANNYRSSICAIGLAKAKNGKIISKKEWLIYPVPFEVGYFQYQVHGLSEKKLENKPRLIEVWEEIKEYIGDLSIVCHNVSFDYSALKASLGYYEIPMIENAFFCSYKLAKKVLQNQISYKLSYLCSLVNFEFNHHKASEDAFACAFLTIELLKTSIASDISIDDWKHFNSYRERIPRPSKLSLPTLEIDEEHLFFDKEVVFTGDLEGIVRKDAKSLVESIGGKCASTVTKNTKFLVIGNFELRKFKEGVEKSSKMIKAETLIQSGQDLQIVDKEYFLELVFK